ncbi:MAG: hypothetical protein Q8O92_01995 [Candidatus Latescibacter sp.]|nr:hypothetical protein [Candidatus Latescibacter sp.]
MAKSPARRDFLTAAVAAAGTLAASSAGAEPRISWKPRTPASRELVRVGVVLGRFTHTKNIWYAYTNPSAGTPRRTGMTITHYWTHWNDVVEDFEKKTGAVRVKNLNDMIGKVDGIIVDEAHAISLQHLAAKPYLESGMPTFVNRPFSSSMKKAKMMVDIARKAGTPIMSGSSFEYLKEAIAARKLVDRKKLLAYEAFNASSDYYTHGLHGIWFAYTCIGGGVARIGTLGRKWWAGPALTYIEHEPRVPDGQPIYGTVRHGATSGGNCGIRVYSPQEQDFDNGPEGTGWARDMSLWTPMLIAMEEMFETGKMPEPYDDILEKTHIFLASLHSLMDLNGGLVDMKSFSDDWDGGSLKPEQYPGNSYTPAELKEYERALSGA